VGRRPQSNALARAELALANLERALQLPPLSGTRRREAIAILHHLQRATSSAAVRPERAECERLREELDTANQEIARLRNLLR